jgi:hypothetical protein
MVIGIPSELYLSAVLAFLELHPLQVILTVFGVAIVLIFSLVYLWKHVAAEREKGVAE